MKFHYVYILQSETNSERFYIGHTDDLQSRLKAHNQKNASTHRNIFHGKSKQPLLLQMRKGLWLLKNILKLPPAEPSQKNDYKIPATPSQKDNPGSLFDKNKSIAA